MEASISLWALKPLFIYLQQNRLLPSIAARQMGLEQLDWNNPDQRVSSSLARELWNYCLEELDQPSLGLKVALALEPGSFGALSYVAINSSTLRQAYLRLARYFSAISLGLRYKFEEKPETIVLRAEFPAAGESVNPLVSQFVLAVPLLYSRKHSSQSVQAQKVLLNYPKSSVDDNYQKVFGEAELCFSQPDCALAFSPGTVDLPMTAPEEGLVKLLEPLLQAQTQTLSDSSELLQQVDSFIAHNLCEELPQIHTAAQHLKLSVRSLQRQLKERKSSYQQRITVVRHRQARRYLAENQLSLAEISFLLGFSEPSSFFRAFKRWQSESPQQYRLRITRG